MSAKPDYLTEDTFLPPEQKYVCMSFLKPEKDDKTTLSGIKVRGVFEEYESACKHAKRLQEADPYHHVFVGEMGKWLPYDPDPDSKYVKDFEYANVQLNSMMKSYVENQEKAKLFHEQRKNDMVRKNIMDNMETHNKNMNELKEQLSTATETEKVDIEKRIKTIETNISNMEQKKKDIEDKLSKLETELGGSQKNNVETFAGTVDNLSKTD
jgi:hypothetical protein